jgi:hypothetical protein
MRACLLVPTLLALLVAAACDSDDDGPAEPTVGDLVVQARSATSFAPAPMAGGTVAPVTNLALAGVAGPQAAPGDVTRYEATFYRFYLAADADCSAPVLLEDYGSTPLRVDLLTDPTLFEVTGTPGSYECIVMRISDVFTFVPETTVGPCIAGTTYSVDTYYDGQTDFLDVDGGPTVGRGDDAAPVDDRVDIFFSTDPGAVAARGFSTNQIVPLDAGAVIPGTTNFVYDLAGVATDQGGECRSGGGSYTFR